MIKLENITKQYKIKGKKYLGRFFVTSLLQTIKTKSSKVSHNNFLALDNISLTINKGEHVGLIGKNKAGKTTLLQIICGITEPNKGRYQITGTIMPAFAQGSVITPDLTGREYIYLHAAALGFSKKDIDTRIDDIIKFSEINTIDTLVKFYSTGMRTRLTLSVTLMLPADIYVFDEVFYGSDTFFKEKAITKLQQILSNPEKTLILVSHNEDIIHSFCKRMILLEHGKVIMDGSLDTVLNYYKSLHPANDLMKNS
ncbi:MAG: ABC transporter ATP-binding protein [Bacteroidetes bacterium]|nr:ABC transporter ATP-binding protein [Bacteroidota bacterium]